MLSLKRHYLNYPRNRVLEPLFFKHWQWRPFSYPLHPVVARVRSTNLALAAYRWDASSSLFFFFLVEVSKTPMSLLYYFPQRPKQKFSFLQKETAKNMSQGCEKESRFWTNYPLPPCCSGNLAQDWPLMLLSWESHERRLLSCQILKSFGHVNVLF